MEIYSTRPKVANFLAALLAVICLSSCDSMPRTGYSSRSPSNISLDTSFGASGFLRNHFSGAGDSTRTSVKKVLPLSSGKILVLADTTSTTLGLRISISRWNADGVTLDTTFASAQSTPGIIEFDLGVGSTIGGDLALQSDGKIIVSGGLLAVANSSPTEGFVLRLTSAGVLDTSFATLGVFRHQFGTSFAKISSLAISATNAITFSGWVSADQTAYQTLIGRLSSSGVLDITFDTDGYRIVNFNSAPDYDIDNASGTSVLLTSAGKAVVITSAFDTAQTENSTIVSRFHTNGSDDNSFSLDGHVHLQNNTYLTPVGAALNSSEQIVILADTTDVALTTAFSVIIRVTTAGAFDVGFGTSGAAIILPPNLASTVYSGGLVITSEGLLVASGMIHSGVSGNGELYTQMFTATGRILSSVNSGLRFEVDTIAGFDEWVFGSSLDSSGRLLVFGEERPPGPTNQFGYITRLTLP